MRYSPSKLQDFFECRLKFKLKHIDGKKSAKASAATVGTAVHNFAEKYAKHCLSQNVEIDFDYAKELESELISGLDPEEADDFLEIVDNFVSNHHFSHKGIKKIGIEEKLAFDSDWKQCDWDDESAYFRGIIDRYYLYLGSIQITDYKTNRRIKRLSEIKNDFQLKTYAWLSHLVFPDVNRFSGTLDFVRYGAEMGPVEYDAKRVKGYGSYLDKIIKRIEDCKAWNPILGSHCSHCGYALSHCPLFKDENLREVFPIDIDSAMRSAEQLYIYEKKVKFLRKMLKEWSDSNEIGLTVGDMDLDFHEQTEKKIKDSKKTIDSLVGLGIPEKSIYEELSLSQTDVKRILKKHHLRKVSSIFVKDNFDDKSKTVFKFKKI